MELDTWLKEQKVTQGEFGARLNPPKTQGQISHYITGLTPIPLAVAAQIEKLTDGAVPVSTWIARAQKAVA